MRNHMRSMKNSISYDDYQVKYALVSEDIEWKGGGICYVRYNQK